MGILKSIKKSLYSRALASKVKVFTPRRQFKGWDSVEAYNILFENEGVFSTSEIIDFAEKLRGRGKQVHLLCYMGQSNKTGLPYKTFSDKDISFNLIPKSNLVQEFADRNANILYNLIPLEKEISEYISSTCKADFKIGLFSEQKSGLDLMVNIKEPNLNEFIKTVEHVLENTYS